MTKGIKKFEDIDAWKKARELAGDIYRLSLQGSLKKDFGLRDQIRRAAVSVMSNIAEGFGKRTNRDFANFLYTAKASAMEVCSHLYVALDQGYLEKEDFDRYYDGYDHIRRMLINLIRHLENNPGAR